MTVSNDGQQAGPDASQSSSLAPTNWPVQDGIVAPDVGYLTVVTEGSEHRGGYLVTNSWGRPLEFRLTTAVQPNRVQQILYGPTLLHYVHSELIGKALVEKTSIRPRLLITDQVTLLRLGSLVELPILGVNLQDSEGLTSLVLRRQACWLTSPAERQRVTALLNALDPMLDFSEPLGRVREAMVEAKKYHSPRAA